MRKDELIGQVAQKLLAERKGEKRAGAEIRHECVFEIHPDPEAYFNTDKGVFKCTACKARGSVFKLAEKLGITVQVTKGDRQTAHEPNQSRHTYRDRNGRPLYAVVRTDEADGNIRTELFVLDAAGNPVGEPGGMGDGERVLYRLDLLADVHDQPVFVVVDERIADLLVGAGCIATTAVGGTDGWSGALGRVYADQLRDRHLVLVREDGDAGGRLVAVQLQHLMRAARSVKVVELPAIRHGKGLAGFADCGDLQDLDKAVATTEPIRPASLDDVRRVWREELRLKDDTVLLALLGAIATRYATTPAVFLLIKGPSGDGKTLQTDALRGMVGVHSVSTVTEASLLSGVSTKDRTEGTKGGLLRELGQHDVIVVKDFTSMLSMQRDARQQVLAALREIHDGHWSRRIGADGGKELSWKGRVTVIACVTDVIEQHHGVIAAMGDRYLTVQTPETDVAVQARSALRQVTKKRSAKDRLSATTAAFFAGLDLENATWPELNEEEENRLVALAALTAPARSPVGRDHAREPDFTPRPERPTRLVQQMASLMLGMRILGVSASESWRVISTVALDCIPSVRRSALEFLMRNHGAQGTAQIAQALAKPSSTTRRALEDLVIHNVIERHSARANADDVPLSEDEGEAGRGGRDKRSDYWSVTPQTANLWRYAVEGESVDANWMTSFFGEGDEMEGVDLGVVRHEQGAENLRGDIDQLTDRVDGDCGRLVEQRAYHGGGAAHD